MHTTRIALHVVATAAVLLASATGARADNTTAPNARELFMGEVQVQSFAAISSRWYKHHLVEGRSYVLLVWAPTHDPSIVAASLDSAVFLNDGTNGVSSVFYSDVEPRMEAISGNNGDQTKIIPTTTGMHRFRVDNNASLGHPVHVMLFETTLFSPWFFHSTASGYDGYITIRNNTSSALIVRIRTYDPTGAQVGSTREVSIPPNGNTFVTASSMGATNTSGSVQIAHNGSINAIAANVTTLSAQTGLSFDAPFTPRMQWSMR
jgi:hypothetical protein